MRWLSQDLFKPAAISVGGTIHHGRVDLRPCISIPIRRLFSFDLDEPVLLLVCRSMVARHDEFGRLKQPDSTDYSKTMVLEEEQFRASRRQCQAATAIVVHRARAWVVPAGLFGVVKLSGYGGLGHGGFMPCQPGGRRQQRLCSRDPSLVIGRFGSSLASSAATQHHMRWKAFRTAG